MPNLLHTPSPENIRRSVDAVLKALNGKKKLDLFQTSRIDPKVPVEQSVGTLSQLVKEVKTTFCMRLTSATLTLDFHFIKG
jgi:aryl-alcohol dehydrogenase-like predicted oxidoreductase